MRRERLRPYWKVTLGYLVFGVLWIAVTDIVSFLVAPSSHVFAAIELLKGWFYVILSAALIFHLTRTAFRLHSEAAEERLELYEKTIRSVHHILLNYLNKMQLVTMEAERHEKFDRGILELSREISDETADELRKLGEIEDVSVESIEELVHRRFEA